MTIQPQNNDLNYLIDSAFTKVNRLFVFSFKGIEENNVQKDHRDFFLHYCVPNVKIKVFNVLIDGKSLFVLPLKNEEEAYEKIMTDDRNNNYTTGNLLDFDYFKEHCILIATDLSKQTKLKDPQQISFIGRLLAVRGATIFFIIPKSEKTAFEVLQSSANINNNSTKDCKFVKQS